jgi:Purple acid Phosphatase, N-terminal domain
MKLNRVPLILAAAAGSLLSSKPAPAQILPPTQRTAHVEITQGPALERAKDTWAIIRWTSSNPGGDDEHFGIVHFGTSAGDLSQTAKSHIRLNRGHPDTIFRVMVNNLKPGTTYYYTVGSMGADGADDHLQSIVQKFTMPDAPPPAGP